ncbi:hypothetical protein LSH36_460g02013 [Paralvinella palmiformis]|uniref:G-protein coupled receptors family 1 profile domain-containing protein n=1 Tax=Paralvinella palmiformis TaxID=53620 RepID=A0AAD9JAG7_9ANNE|nr:hypothetical protein LSH36_460g02013 [Paralvinella palmiformis]
MDLRLVLSRNLVLTKLITYLYPILSVWVIIVNGLTLFVFAKYKQLQKKRNVMIISLSAVDLFTGMTQFLPKAIGFIVGADKSFAICMTATAVQIAPPWASIFHLVAVAIERHIAITRPLLYHVIITPTRLAVAVTGNIAAAFFFALVPLAWPRDQFQDVCLSILWYPTAYRHYVGMLYTVLVVNGTAD